MTCNSYPPPIMIRYAKVRGQVLTLPALQAAILSAATTHPNLSVQKALTGWVENAVKRWPPDITRPAVGDAHAGYFWLAFDLMNYCTSCITCNRERKRNFFPVAGTRGKPGQSLHELNATEQPMLVYPLGTVDDDP